MKKKILSSLMTLAICLTLNYNYSNAKESTSLTNSLKQLAKVEFATAEEGEEDDCEGVDDDFIQMGYDDDEGTYFYWDEYVVCEGNRGSCEASEYSALYDLTGEEIAVYVDYSAEEDC